MARSIEPHHRTMSFFFSRRHPRDLKTPATHEHFSMRFFVKRSYGENFFKKNTPQHGLFEIFRKENRQNIELRDRVMSFVLYKRMMSKTDFEEKFGHLHPAEEESGEEAPVLKVLFAKRDSYYEWQEEKEYLQVNLSAETSQGENPYTDKESTAYLFFECFRPENRENHTLGQKALAFALLDGLAYKNLIRKREIPEDVETQHGNLEMLINERSQEEDQQEGFDVLLQVIQALNMWENEQSD